MNLVAVQNQLKSLSDQQLAQELMSPTGAAPGFLILSELKNRKDMRTSFPTEMPQGSMADEYGKGLMSGGAPNLYGAMGQSQATGQATPYGGGNVMAQRMPNPMGGAASPQAQMPKAFAEGGGVGDIDIMRRAGRQYGIGVMPPQGEATDYYEGMHTPPIFSESPYIQAMPNGSPRALGQVQRRFVDRSVDPLSDMRMGRVPPPIAPEPRGAITLPRPDWSAYPSPVEGSPNIVAEAPPRVQPSYGQFSGPAMAGGLQAMLNRTELPPAAPEGGTPTESPLGGGPPVAANSSPGGSGGAGGPSSPQAAAASGGPGGLAEWIKMVRENMPETKYDKLHADNAKARADLMHQREVDKGLALLQAGLGVLAGTSSNAGVNIGRGGMMGVQAYGQMSKDTQNAERDLRRDTSALAIAEGNQESRSYDRAIAMWQKQQDSLQRHLDRQAAAGVAASNSADRAADRKEARELAEISGVLNEVKANAGAIHNLRRDYAAAIDPLKGGSPTSPEALEIKRQIGDLQQQQESSMEYLRARRGERDTKKGRAPVQPKKVAPAGVYVPGQGIQWSSP